LFFCHFYSIFFCNFAELLKRLACEKLVFQQISFAKLETANFTVCPLQEKSGRLQLTSGGLAKAGGSPNQPRRYNFFFTHKTVEPLHPRLRQTFTLHHEKKVLSFSKEKRK
jgi:hypothetical protein